MQQYQSRRRIQRRYEREYTGTAVNVDKSGESGELGDL